MTHHYMVDLARNYYLHHAPASLIPSCEITVRHTRPAMNYSVFTSTTTSPKSGPCDPCTFPHIVPRRPLSGHYEGTIFAFTKSCPCPVQFGQPYTELSKNPRKSRLIIDTDPVMKFLPLTLLFVMNAHPFCDILSSKQADHG